MAYDHFGKFADVWKHLLLCTALETERPTTYIESNSASAEYRLESTKEQLHGIFNFLKAAPSSQLLADTAYFRMELAAYRRSDDPIYLGSPALAMGLLNRHETNLTFFDIDPSALQSIRIFAQSHAPLAQITLAQQDSVSGIRNMLDDLSQEAFLFFDPYDPLDRNPTTGDNYLELFLPATAKNIRSLLWYGFDRLQEEAQFHQLLMSRTNDNEMPELIEFITRLRTIHSSDPGENPGVFGCGIVCSNLSGATVERMSRIATELPAIYRGIQLYENQSGELETEIRLHR